MFLQERLLHGWSFPRRSLVRDRPLPGGLRKMVLPLVAIGLIHLLWLRWYLMLVVKPVLVLLRRVLLEILQGHGILEGFHKVESRCRVKFWLLSYNRPLSGGRRCGSTDTMWFYDHWFHRIAIIAHRTIQVRR